MVYGRYNEQTSLLGESKPTNVTFGGKKRATLIAYHHAWVNYHSSLTWILRPGMIPPNQNHDKPYDFQGSVATWGLLQAMDTRFAQHTFQLGLPRERCKLGWTNNSKFTNWFMDVYGTTIVNGANLNQLITPITMVYYTYNL